MNFKGFFTNQQLDEKLIVINQGKKYGQIVFFAGGAGSGKDFAIKNFMENDKFKIIDPDQLMEFFLKLEKVRGGRFKNIDLSNPNDVTRVYDYIRNEKQWKYKSIELIFADLHSGVLPNIIFNTTLSWPKTLEEYIRRMEKLGYEKRNMHLVWVLSDYKVAVERNKKRTRVVDANVILDTHVGAANNLHDLLIKSASAYPMDGGAYVILNNQENTIYWDDTKEKSKLVVKDFTYLTVKKPGKKMEPSEQITNQLKQWIKDNVPRTEETKDLFEAIKTSIKKEFGRELTTRIPVPNKYQVVHNFPLKIAGLSVDIIADIQEDFAEVIYKKNNKPFLAQVRVNASQPERWVEKLKQDRRFIEYLKKISK